MSSDRTEHQSVEAQEYARDLSLQSTRPPADVEGYETHRLLGRGAFGEVWIGVDRSTGRQVAIKFYTQRSRMDWSAMAREVEKLVFLAADRYVVQLLDVGWESTPPYYVMEYIEQGSLEDLLRKRGTLPAGEAVEIFRELAIGLVHVHGKGILHCDLKPANVLLDQDLKPRLADFGQSRLSNEQSPALGTLFYMAPEQADLNAVPDARWDVYALGAILYCLLTGQPPYRDSDTISALDSAGNLSKRLAKYRKVIQASKPLTAHRRVRGADRALGDIIDRCLAVSPNRRFANVQNVVDALRRRDEARLRNPLMFLGFVGPIMLLAIMALFGLRGYEKAVSDSTKFIRLRAGESNGFAAKFAAGSIEGEINRYFTLIETEATRSEFLEQFRKVSNSDQVQEINRRNQEGESIAALRDAFIADPERKELNDQLQGRLKLFMDRLAEDPGELKLASVFAVDREGRMLAVAYDHNEPSRSLGWNYSWRTYFTGLPADQREDEDPKTQPKPSAVQPIDRTHFSAPFKSTTTGLWKVAISTPVRVEGEVAGVLAVTVNLGDFAYFRSNMVEDHFAILIDGRPGPNRGVIIQHPLFDRMGQEGGGPSEDYRTSDARVSSAQLARLRTDFTYHDPLSVTEAGRAYGGEWIAATANVSLPAASSDGNQLIVLVQERLSDATQPVQLLGRRLKQEGLWALGGVAAVVLVLWYIVLRLLNEPHRQGRGRLLLGKNNSLSQNLTTLENNRGSQKQTTD